MRRLLYHILFLVARRLILAPPDANQSGHPHGPQHKPGVATYGQLDYPTMLCHYREGTPMQGLGSPRDRPPTLRLARRHQDPDRSTAR